MSEHLADLTNGVNPFSRYDWSGRLVSLDGTDASDIAASDVAEVVCSGTTDEGDWDGTVAAVLKLKDGRFCCYETFWGPTGSGFSEDAYGGNADISFASTLGTVLVMGLTDEGRSLCGVPIESVAAIVWEREWLDAHSGEPGGRP